MHVRDATGRQVSLLNDEAASYQRPAHPLRLSYLAAGQFISQPHNSAYARSASSSPHTPDLLRSCSYDSHSSEPVSPVTPMTEYLRLYAPTADDRSSSYQDYGDPAQAFAGFKRPRAFSSNRAVSYEDDAYCQAGSERPGKRYPCRYRDSHGCGKTFTTSGHASRHSKIHTAEKAVQCTFSGCTKKFTRADNMKQHLDTHYKDRSRTLARPPLYSEKRSSCYSKISSRKAAAAAAMASLPMMKSASAAWDSRRLANLPLPDGRPTIVRTPSSGLEALAMAVVAQARV